MFGIPTMFFLNNILLLLLLAGLVLFLDATWRSMKAQEAMSKSLKEITEMMKEKNNI